MKGIQIVKEQKVENPLPGSVERPGTPASTACQLPAGEGGPQSLWIPVDCRVQNHYEQILSIHSFC